MHAGPLKPGLGDTKKVLRAKLAAAASIPALEGLVPATGPYCTWTKVRSWRCRKSLASDGSMNDVASSRYLMSFRFGSALKLGGIWPSFALFACKPSPITHHPSPITHRPSIIDHQPSFGTYSVGTRRLARTDSPAKQRKYTAAILYAIFPKVPARPFATRSQLRKSN